MQKRTTHLLSLDRQHVWHPFTQTKSFEAEPPWVVDHAEGVWIHTHQGRMLDGIASWWVNLLGHRNPRLDAALKAQIDRVAHVMFARFTHEPAVELARGLAQLTPGDLNRVFYSDNGSTAVEVGLKMAFQFWQNQGQKRPHFIAFESAYHGDTLGAVAVGGVKTYHAHWAPLLFPVLRAPSPYAWPRPSGDQGQTQANRALEAVEELLRGHPGQVAGIITEPLIQAASGIATHPPSFLKGLRALADRYDTLLLIDEVATGFGRTGRLWACDHADVVPDIMMVSKAITGGYLPLAATVTTERVFDAFYGDAEKTFYHGHSYTANPLAASLGVEVVDIVGQAPWQEDIARRADHFQAAWRGALSGLKHVADPRGLGFVAAVSLMEDVASARPYPASAKMGHRVCMKAIEKGLFIRPLGDVIYLWPPVIITPAEVEWACSIVAEAIAELTEG